MNIDNFFLVVPFFSEKTSDSSSKYEELLDSLNLVVDGKLTRAAILLFHRRPERLFGGAFVKVGFFGDGPDLQY